jgi:protein-disulfide isomerase
MKQLFYGLFFIITLSYQNPVIAKILTSNNLDTILPATQTHKFEQIMYDYKLQEKARLEKEAQIAKIRCNILKYKTQIFSLKAPGRVILGHPKGKIIIAEFTQHQCPHCQEAALVIDKLLTQYPEVQLITIYWPFFGNDAVYTAKAVLAAVKQNKARELNQLFFNQQGFTTKDKANAIIQKVPQLNSKKLSADMRNKEFDQGLKNNIKLAEDLGLTGTPIFIFTNQKMTKFGLIPGHTANFEKELVKTLQEVS